MNNTQKYHKIKVLWFFGLHFPKNRKFYIYFGYNKLIQSQHMKNKNIIYIFIGIIVVLFGFVLFGQQQAPDVSNSDDIMAEQRPLRVGIIAPFTGPLATAAESIKRSVELVETDVLEFVYEDDSCEPKKAILAYQKLKSDGVNIFSVACSGSVLAIAPLAKEKGDLIVTAYAGSIDIRKTGPEVIRFVPDGLSVVEAMKSFFQSYPDYDFGLFHEQQDYANSVADEISSTLGDRIIVRESYSADELNFKTELLKISNEKIDALIFVPVSEKTAEKVYKDIRELDIDLPLIGDVNVCDYGVQPSEYGISGMCWRAELATDGYKKFMEMFNEAYATNPSYPFYDSLTYESIQLLNTIVNDGNRDVENIKQKILSGGKGAIVNLEFDKQGNATARDYLKKIEF